MAEKQHKILLGLTTTPGSDWRGKIEEVDELKIEELALFLTDLEKWERDEAFRLLKGTSLKRCPHVHIRSDMVHEELDYLVSRYSTQAFNVHPIKSAFPPHEQIAWYREKIFVENLRSIPSEEELEYFGGLCIDFSHWENIIRLGSDNNYDSFIREKISKFKVGCSHISAIRDNYCEDGREKGYAFHKLIELSEMDYVKKYEEFLPELISLELENSFKEQLQVKKYLEKIIYEKK